MADQTAVLPEAAGPGADERAEATDDRGRLEGRGRTRISSGVLERIAVRAALEVPGAVRHTPGPDALAALTSSLPRASAENAGERVAVALSVAAEWPAGAVEVAAAVREHVRDRLAAITGRQVDRVDVTVAALVPHREEQTRRVE